MAQGDYCDHIWTAGISVDDVRLVGDLLRIAMSMGLDCEHGEGEVRVFDEDRQKVADWLTAVGRPDEEIGDC